MQAMDLRDSAQRAGPQAFGVCPHCRPSDSDVAESIRAQSSASVVKAQAWAPLGRAVLDHWQRLQAGSRKL